MDLIGEPLNVFRGDTDKYGNPQKEPHGTVEGVFAWGGKFGADRVGDSRSESRSLTVELYVKRGADLKARDRVRRANGQTYAVVGHAAWDQLFPFDGFDFGYMVFQLEAVNS